METPNLDMNFNLEEDFVADPLIPNGSYRGNVTNVSYDADKMAIVWEVTLADNGGVMNDGETPVDGAKQWYRNWLPKPGDENTPTPSGKTNKRQAKINMLAQFAKEMGVNMNTPQDIIEGITNAEWIGKEVIATIGIKEFEGKFSNEITRMKAI